jgi:hypothetical protein
MFLHCPNTISSLWHYLKALGISHDDIWRESVKIAQRLGRLDRQITKSVSYSDVF